MTYRETFDPLGKPRKQPSQRRQYLGVLLRWVAVVLGLLAWAHLVHWMDS